MIKQYLPRIFFGMGVTAFIFGLIGFNAFDAFDSKNIFKALINTLQMYVLNLSANEFNDFFKKNPGSFKNVLLVIAAFLAPLSTIGALLAAFGQRISHWFDLHIKSLWQTTDYVFIGGGVMASSISQRICENNKKIKIIGLDLNENCKLAHAFEKIKCNHVMHFGDALNDNDLRCLKLHKAKTIWISTGDDLLNIQYAQRVIDLINDKKISGSINININTRNLDFSRKTDILFNDFDLSKINLALKPITRTIARSLLLQFPPILGDEQTAPHILIVGMSDLSESLLIHAIQHCVYHDSESVAITLAGKGANQKLASLREKFVGLSDNPTLHNLLPLAKINAIDCDEDEFSLDKWTYAQKEQTFNTIFVACMTDEETLTAATRIASLREVTIQSSATLQQIVACFWQSNNTNNQNEIVFTENNAKYRIAKELFGINVYDLLQLEMDKKYEEADIFAMFINAVYTNDKTKDNKENVFIKLGNQLSTNKLNELRDAWINKAKTIWGSVDKDTYRWSSRLSGDHVAIKLAILQRLSGSKKDLSENLFLLEQLVFQHKDLLARVEHKRFIAERIIEGWLPLPKQLKGGDQKNYSESTYAQQKSILHVNTSLEPYSDLDECEQKKDYNIIEPIAEFIACKNKIMTT